MPVIPIVSGMWVCQSCQRFMVQTNTTNLFYCRYCGAVRWKVAGELTGIVLSWFTASSVTNVNNTPLEYWSSNQIESVYPPDNTVPNPVYPYSGTPILFSEGVVGPAKMDDQADEDFGSADTEVDNELSELPPDDESSR